MELKVIAYARNGHTDKFGIPRQSRDESPILTRIVFEPDFCVREALRGIEGYSHLWVIWGFSDNERKKDEEERTLAWSPTVRPPRLGGNRRMGVFATRSPFRPNPIGLSSVRLVRIEKIETTRSRDHVTTTGNEAKHEGATGKRLALVISGADLLDGTPIYDIKPYLSFSDSHPDALNGFAEETRDYRLAVDWGDVIMTLGEYHTKHPLITHLSPTDNTIISRKELEEIAYILGQDPRPAYQKDPNREYKLDYGGWRVTFCIAEKPKDEKERTKEEVVIVKKIEKIEFF